MNNPLLVAVKKTNSSLNVESNSRSGLPNNSSNIIQEQRSERGLDKGKKLTLRAIINEQRFIKRLKYNDPRQKVVLQNEKLQFLRKKAKELTVPSKGIIDISHTFEALKKHLLPKSSNVFSSTSISSRSSTIQQECNSQTTVDKFDRLNSDEKLAQIIGIVNEIMQMFADHTPSASPRPKNLSFKDDGVNETISIINEGDNLPFSKSNVECSAQVSFTREAATDSETKSQASALPSNRPSLFPNTKAKKDETSDKTMHHLVKLLEAAGGAGRGLRGAVGGVLAPPGTGLPHAGPRLKALATELSKQSILLGTVYEMQPEEYKLYTEPDSKSTAELDKLNQHKENGIAFIKISHDLKMEPNHQKSDNSEAAQATARRCRQCQDVPLLPVVVMTITTPPLSNAFEKGIEDEDQNGDYFNFVNESISILINSFASYKVCVDGVVLCLPAAAAPPPCWPVQPAASALATASHFIHPIARQLVPPCPTRRVRIPYQHFDSVHDFLGLSDKDRKSSDINNNKRYVYTNTKVSEEINYKFKMPRVGVCKMVNKNNVRHVRQTAESMALAVQTSLPPAVGGVLYCVRGGVEQQRDLQILNELNKVPTPRWPFHVAFLSHGPDDAALLAALAEVEAAARPPGTHGRGLTTHGPGHQSDAHCLARQLQRVAADASTASMGQGTAADSLNSLNFINNIA